MSSRSLTANYYLNLKNINHGSDYLSTTVCNMTYLSTTVCNMTGSSFDIPHTPFGPYVIAGFFYAVKHLQLKDQMVMGYDQQQTGRILQKIKNDPLMNMIVNKFDMELIAINQGELELKLV